MSEQNTQMITERTSLWEIRDSMVVYLIKHDNDCTGHRERSRNLVKGAIEVVDEAIYSLNIAIAREACAL